MDAEAARGAAADAGEACPPATGEQGKDPEMPEVTGTDATFDDAGDLPKDDASNDTKGDASMPDPVAEPHGEEAEGVQRTPGVDAAMDAVPHENEGDGRDLPTLGDHRSGDSKADNGPEVSLGPNESCTDSRGDAIISDPSAETSDEASTDGSATLSESDGDDNGLEPSGPHTEPATAWEYMDQFRNVCAINPTKMLLLAVNRCLHPQQLIRPVGSNSWGNVESQLPLLRYDGLYPLAEEMWLGTTLVWYYLDKSAEIQGPCSGNDMMEFFHDGYLTEKSLIAPTRDGDDAPSNTISFSLLGEVFMRMLMLVHVLTSAPKDAHDLLLPAAAALFAPAEGQAWFYISTGGDVQGPHEPRMMLEWFMKRLLPADVPVCLVEASKEPPQDPSDFQALGHLLLDRQRSLVMEE